MDIIYYLDFVLLASENKLKKKFYQDQKVKYNILYIGVIIWLVESA